METPLTNEEKHTALFAQMVMQSASMSLVLMGRAPNPVTGKTETDLDTARMFIEQLEMLEVKTRGNLSKEEQHLLNQNLMTVRMAFVESVENAKKKRAVPETASPAQKDSATTESAPADAEPDSSSKKRFSKNYGEG